MFYMLSIKAYEVDMFPQTSISEKTAKNLSTCSHKRKGQKLTNDINAVLSSHVEAVVLIERKKLGIICQR